MHYYAELCGIMRENYAELCIIMHLVVGLLADGGGGSEVHPLAATPGPQYSLRVMRRSASCAVPPMARTVGP